MQRPFRLRTFLLYLIVIAALDEVVVHTSRPIAPAIALAPVAYDAIVLTAAAAGSLYSAYVISQLADNVLRAHSQALPQVAHELQEIFPATAKPNYTHQPAPLAQELETAIGNASYKKAYKSQFSTSQIDSLIDTIQAQIISPAVSRATHISSIPSIQLRAPSIAPSMPSPPIQVTYQPHAIHFEIPHINTYGSISVTQERRLSPVKQHVINECHNHAVNEFVFKERCRRIPGYLDAFNEHLNATIRIFHDLVTQDIFKRANACLIFPQLELEGPYNYVLQNVIHELIPLYYDTDGKLERLTPHDTVARNFIIAKFLKNGITRSMYLQLLRDFNFQEVLDHEEYTGTYLWNGICHITTGGWLPSLSWYPHNIQDLIDRNTTNLGLEKILNYCSKHKFIEAKKIVNGASSEVPTWHAVYEETYALFKQKHCDAYGILKEYIDDPLWANASDESKEAISKNIEEITLFNNALRARAIQKKAMQHAWVIPAEAPQCVHTTLYQLIESLGTGTKFINKVFELLEKYQNAEQAALVEALFLPNGILKDFSNFTATEKYKFPTDTASYPKLLNIVNRLFYQQHAFAGTEQGENARSALDNLQRIYNPKFLCKIHAAKTHANNLHVVASENSEQAPQPESHPTPHTENPAPEASAPKPEASEEEEIVIPEISFIPDTPSKSSPSRSGDNLINPNNETPPPNNDPANYIVPLKPPNNPNDWPPEKKWVPPSGNWNPKQAKAYLEFIGNSCLRACLATVGIPYEDFEYALEIFKEIPSFLNNNSAFQQVIRFCYEHPIKNWHQIKGMIYELQIAIRIEKSGDKIVEFGRKIPGSEIDLISKTRFIECKNISWEFCESLQKLKSTFGNQTKYIFETWGKRLTVYSKNPLPPELKDFLVQRNIEYFEG